MSHMVSEMGWIAVRRQLAFHDSGLDSQRVVQEKLPPPDADWDTVNADLSEEEEARPGFSQFDEQRGRSHPASVQPSAAGGSFWP